MRSSADLWARLGLVALAAGVVAWPARTVVATGAASAGASASVAYGIAAAALVVAGVVAGATDPRPPRVDVHDREADAIVGGGLLVVALAVLIAFPGQVGDLAPLWRPDLLGATLFLAGALCLTVGVRAAWRCWPALLGVALLHPAVVDVVLAPLARVVANASWVAAEAASGSGARWQPGVPATLTWPADGVFLVVPLAAALRSAAWVPVAVAAAAVAAVTVRGALVARLATVVVAAVVTGGALVGRTALGVALAAGAPGWSELVLGPGGLAAALALAGLVVAATGWWAGLRVPVERWRSPALGGRRIGLGVASAVVAGAAVVAVIVSPAPARVASVPTPVATELAAAAGGLRASADGARWSIPDQVEAHTTHAPSPYGDLASAGDGWQRTSYTGAGASGPLVVDVLDAPDASALAAYPARLLYRPPGTDQVASRLIEIAPGVEATSSEYRAADGRVILSALAWAWPNDDGGVRQVVLLAPGPAATAGVPAPRVDVGGALRASLTGIARGRAEVVMGEPGDEAPAVADARQRLVDHARSFLGEGKA